MSELITSLLIDGSPKVREVAQLILDVEKALTERTITKEEFHSLLFDIERLQEVIAESDNARVDIMLHRAVMGLIELAKAVG